VTADKNNGDGRRRGGIRELEGTAAVFVLFAACSVFGGAQSIKTFYQSAQYSVSSEGVVEGPYTARALSSTEIVSNYPMRSGEAARERRWRLQADLSGFPAFRSGDLLLDAVYNLSLEELTKDISQEGTFDAGAQWPGVWTRDVSYSTLLSLAAIDPRRAMASLLRKVKRERIVQDTGTGGSWPISSDRVCWALAAWEVYLVTGNRQWLEQSAAIVENSIRDDEQVVIDAETGLARGESSFLDWREQTYPRWMEPADIYSSENLGTNAVYYRVYRILGAMDRELGKPALDWDAKADRIRSAMNALMWMPDQGRYGQYLYGRVWPVLSPRSEALGEALSVLFEIPSAAQRKAIMTAQPLMPYGIPTVYPETPGIPPYHNRSVWPFVQAFWNLAAAKQDNEAALLQGLAAIYRAAGLFLTNKENFVAANGQPGGTEVNSDRQLWSVAGSLAMVYRVFFGMEFAPDGLHLHPVVPRPLAGTRTLTNFHYRAAILSITVNGYGGRVRRMTIDGVPAAPLIPAHLSGHHTIVIELAHRPGADRPVRLVRDNTAPDTPVPHFDGSSLLWKAIEGASRYQIYRNGKPLMTTTGTEFHPQPSRAMDQFQITALDADGEPSFLSEPVLAVGHGIVFPAASTPAGTHAASFVALEQTGAAGLSISGEIPADGLYAIAFRYANGSGPINTSNKCAIRTLFVDGNPASAIVLPQRGTGEWENWGLSNSQIVRFAAGRHTLELRLLPADRNMDGTVNRARIQSVEVMRID
jgi:hypothetical protein